IGGAAVPLHFREHQALLDALADAADGSARGRWGSTVALRSRDGKRYVAHVLPLTFDRRRPAANRRNIIAAIFVRRAAVHPSTVEILGRHYQLTPTELRVVFAMMEIGGVQQVAQVVGISDNTVKTHLRRVFAKTGTNRQADLVKLVACFANPLGE